METFNFMLLLFCSNALFISCCGFNEIPTTTEINTFSGNERSITNETSSPQADSNKINIDSVFVITPNNTSEQQDKDYEQTFVLSTNLNDSKLDYNSTLNINNVLRFKVMEIIAINSVDNEENSKPKSNLDIESIKNNLQRRFSNYNLTDLKLRSIIIRKKRVNVSEPMVEKHIEFSYDTVNTTFPPKEMIPFTLEDAVKPKGNNTSVPANHSPVYKPVTNVMKPELYYPYVLKNSVQKSDNLPYHPPYVPTVKEPMHINLPYPKIPASNMQETTLKPIVKHPVLDFLNKLFRPARQAPRVETASTNRPVQELLVVGPLPKPLAPQFIHDPYKTQLVLPNTENNKFS